MTAMTRRDFDAQICEDCGTPDHDLTLVPVCHPEAGFQLGYIRATGRLQLWCIACKAPIGEIQVAGERDLFPAVRPVQA